MQRKAAADSSPSADPSAAVSARSAWWARLCAAVPLPLLYGFASLIGWLSVHVYPYREHVVRENLGKAFPDFDAARLRAVIRGYYYGYADMLVEIIKAVSMPGAELRRRVRIVNLEAPRAHLAAGHSVLLVAAHQCNWEWMLLGLSLELGYPVDAAYKPLVNDWAEREMKGLRSRFGCRLVPAQELLPDIIKRRDMVRAVAMVADQEPTKSELKHWTRFPAFFIAMRRVARGYYEMEFRPFTTAVHGSPSGALTEEYARRVEEQIRAAPSDWPWSHKRWKLKRSLYQGRARGAA